MVMCWEFAARAFMRSFLNHHDRTRFPRCWLFYSPDRALSLACASWPLQGCQRQTGACRCVRTHEICSLSLLVSANGTLKWYHSERITMRRDRAGRERPFAASLKVDGSHRCGWLLRLLAVVVVSVLLDVRLVFVWTANSGATRPQSSPQGHGVLF